MSQSKIWTLFILHPSAFILLCSPSQVADEVVDDAFEPPEFGFERFDSGDEFLVLDSCGIERTRIAGGTA